MMYRTNHQQALHIEKDFSNVQSKTQQQFKEDVSIHRIVDKYRKTGEMPVETQKALFGDFSNIQTYHDAQNAIIRANEAFMRLNPKIRERFGHDPAQLIQFMQHEENRKEAEELGLIPKKEPVRVPLQSQKVEPPVSPAPSST